MVTGIPPPFPCGFTGNDEQTDSVSRCAYCMHRTPAQTRRSDTGTALHFQPNPTGQWLRLKIKMSDCHPLNYNDNE